MKMKPEERHGCNQPFTFVLSGSPSGRQFTPGNGICSYCSCHRRPAAPNKKAWAWSWVQARRHKTPGRVRDRETTHHAPPSSVHRHSSTTCEKRWQKQATHGHTERNDHESVVITSHHDLPRLRRWAGYIALCVGMFMAILDIQVVVTSLKTIEEALNIGADRMSWVQTSYLIAEVIAIPIIGLAHAGLRHEAPVRRCAWAVHLCLDRLRVQHRLLGPDGVARHSGFCRGRSDSAGLLCHLPALSEWP